MVVPMLSRAVFRSRAASWRSFLLTINLSHARQVTYEVWGFHVTDGDFCSDWGDCNGCFCRDESGNNWPSVDDFHSAKISACRATSLPRMRKILCAKKEPGPPQEATSQTGWWTSFPLFTVWWEIYHLWWSTFSYEQCSSEDKPFNPPATSVSYVSHTGINWGYFTATRCSFQFSPNSRMSSLDVTTATAPFAVAVTK